MFKTIRKLIEIAKHYDIYKESEATYNRERFNTLGKQVTELRNIIKERTTVHADVSPYGNESQVIVIGRYRNHDYINLFTITDNSLAGLIDVLKKEQEYAHLGKIDCPKMVQASIFRELK